MDKQQTYVDKKDWGDGPWQREPDRVLWKHKATGYFCLVRRNEHCGNWCGYVGVPAGHPAFGKGYDDIDVDVHGGLTYAAGCTGDPERGICHVGDDDVAVHWFGFDCAHAWDLCPGFKALASLSGPGTEYRSLAYVKKQCVRLAEQLAAMTNRGKRKLVL